MNWLPFGSPGYDPGVAASRTLEGPFFAIRSMELSWAAQVALQRSDLESVGLMDGALAPEETGAKAEPVQSGAKA
jgi:hypothetical protein